MFTSRTRTGLAACATFALLGLVASATHAQSSLTLSGSDAVTVDSTGTHGTLNKAPVSNSTTAYGNTSYFGSAVDAEGTAFTLGTGGSITATGYSTAVYAVGSNSITITGGTIVSNYDGIAAVGSNIVTISGGSISAGSSYALNAGGNSRVTITGGTFTGGNYVLLANGNGPTSITGGTFTAGNNGYVLDVQASDSTIDLYGMFDGYALGNTALTNNGIGSFTGTLTNNTASQTFTYSNNGTIRLHALAAAPEPSQYAAFTVGLLGLGALGLGALALKAKRRTA